MAATISPVSPTSSINAPPAEEPARFSLSPGVGQTAIISLLGLLGLIAFAYWEVLHATALAWSQPQYSHGWIIPLIGLYILWSRRPNPTGQSKQDRANLDLLIRGGIGLMGLAVAGYSMKWGVISGVGLVGACLAWLTAGLLGQPFAARGENKQTNYTPLWVTLGVGAGVILLGLTATIGVTLPGLHPGYYQILGLIVLLIGGLVVANVMELGHKAGLPEMVYATATVGFSLACWSYAVKVDMMPLARFSFVTALFGVFAMVGGLRLIQWAGPSVGFTLFMFPLPTVVEQSVLNVLQKIAVSGAQAVYTIIGIPVVREGNVLTLQGVSEDIQMEVIGACSGLAMSTILVAMAIAIVLLINRPWWDKLVILLSSLPIALLANIFRITATGLIWVFVDKFFPTDAETTGPLRDLLHDNAGILLMMPFAMGLYWLEFKVLSLLTAEEDGIEETSAGMLGRTETAPLP